MTLLQINPLGLGELDDSFITEIKIISDGEEVILTPAEDGTIEVPQQVATNFVRFGQRFKLTGR